MSEVLVLQHEFDVPLGRLADYLPHHRIWRLWEDDTPLRNLLEVATSRAPLPSAVVVLGGRMNAYDDERAPWLPLVRELIRRCAHYRVPVLGICLGHQLIAAALGGKVAVGAAAGPEYGVTPITWEPGVDTDRVGRLLHEYTCAFEDHGDAVVELPPGAIVLARSEKYVQAMRLGLIVGVQFHPEVDRVIALQWQQENHETDTEEIVAGYCEHEAELTQLCRAIAQWITRAAAVRV